MGKFSAYHNPKPEDSLDGFVQASELPISRKFLRPTIYLCPFCDYQANDDFMIVHLECFHQEELKKLKKILPLLKGAGFLK